MKKVTLVTDGTPRRTKLVDEDGNDLSSMIQIASVNLKIDARARIHRSVCMVEVILDDVRGWEDYERAEAQREIESNPREAT